jgi:hypothetical protein
VRTQLHQESLIAVRINQISIRATTPGQCPVVALLRIDCSCVCHADQGTCTRHDGVEQFHADAEDSIRGKVAIVREGVMYVDLKTGAGTGPKAVQSKSTQMPSMNTTAS